MYCSGTDKCSDDSAYKLANKRQISEQASVFRLTDYTQLQESSTPPTNKCSK